MNRYISTLLLIILTNFQIPAQKSREANAESAYKNSTCSVYYPKLKLSLPINEKTLADYLIRNYKNLKADDAGLRLNYMNESPGGIHFSFTQTFRGIEIYQSEMKVNLDKQGTIRSVFDNSFDTDGWFVEELGFSENRVILIDKISENPIVTSRVTNNNIELFYYGGEVVFQIDMNTYFSAPDSLVVGKVFMPDPLTSAQQVYGGNFSDRGDSTNASLEAQLQTVNFVANFDGSTFTLENNFVQLRDLDAPFVQTVTSNSPQFFFNRSQPGFEDVNVFYHINTFRNYIAGLGFDLANSTIQLDPHGTTADNSYFSSSANPPRILYGVGGVDDAEDADVIIHEYGHFLSFRASPNSNFGPQRQSIDEGSCDYFAGGYSQAISNFNSNWVFNWDGHNEYWPGRVLNTTRVYPQDLSSGIYRNGEIWSAALTDIKSDIGRVAMDSILLQAMYGFAQNMAMDAAAQLLIDADTMLTNGRYYCPIYRNLYNRGLVPFYSSNPCGVSAIITLNGISGRFMQTGNSFTFTNEENRKAEVRIFDVNGSLVHSDVVPGNSSFSYSNSKLLSGVYLVSMVSESLQATYKWVKTN
jgi:Zn-dependent metalloprotease